MLIKHLKVLLPFNLYYEYAIIYIAIVACKSSYTLALTVGLGTSLALTVGLGRRLCTNYYMQIIYKWNPFSSL